jgi:site-specific DNA recombinase
MQMKAAIYARVSPKGKKIGETIESQVDAIKHFATETGYQISDKLIFQDNLLTGKTMQRPALDELRDMVRTETIDTIFIYSPDRLARNYPHQLILLDEFRRYGAKVHFLKDAPQGNTPEAIMFNHFQGIIAEYENALIADRSRRGIIYKAKKGDQAVLPSIPIGYRRVKNGRNTSIEISEEHATIVKEIFRLYVHEKMSLEKIVKRLAEKGIKSPKGNIRWERSTVRDILKNPAYTGVAYFGKTEQSEGVSKRIKHHRSGKFMKPKYARKKLPAENWIPINIPIIIGENDFELAQEQLKRNKELAARNTKEPGLLQGLVICGECSYPFYKRYRKQKEKSIGHYYCRSKTDKKLKKCNNRSINQKELDEMVYEEVIKLLQNPSLVKQELERRVKESNNNEDLLRQEINLKKEVAKILQERDRLLDAYQSSLIDLKELKKRSCELDKRRTTHDNELKARQDSKVRQETANDVESFFMSIIDGMKSKAKNLSFDKKQKLIRLLVENVIITKDEIKICHCVSPKFFVHENGQLCSDACEEPTV